MGLPFLQMPYQCFQEALKVIAQDREQKVAQIKATAGKIRRLEESDGSQLKKGVAMKELRLKNLRKYLEELKILADSNSPLVKKNFEDGLGMFLHGSRRGLALTGAR
jgi:large subunit ribosomal protein L35